MSKAHELIGKLAESTLTLAPDSDAISSLANGRYCVAEAIEHLRIALTQVKGIEGHQVRPRPSDVIAAALGRLREDAARLVNVENQLNNLF